MPLFSLFVIAGVVVGFAGLTGHGDLTLIGIACLVVGVLGLAATSTHRRERDRRLDQADRAQADRLARR